MPDQLILLLDLTVVLAGDLLQLRHNEHAHAGFPVSKLPSPASNMIQNARFSRSTIQVRTYLQSALTCSNIFLSVSGLQEFSLLLLP